MTYNLDWRGWPQGWDRSNPFRTINFLGKTASDTYQNVFTANGQTVYCCRRGDTRVLEIRFRGRVAYAYSTPERERQHVTSTAWVDWPKGWQARKGDYVPHAWRQVVRQALQITSI